MTRSRRWIRARWVSPSFLANSGTHYLVATLIKEKKGFALAFRFFLAVLHDLAVWFAGLHAEEAAFDIDLAATFEAGIVALLKYDLQGDSLIGSF